MKTKLERKTIGGALKVDIFQSLKTVHSEEKSFWLIQNKPKCKP